MAWLPGWSYRKAITITGQAGAGTNYQVDLDVGNSTGGDFHLEGHCANFPQDIAVTDNDETTLLDFWIKDITADPIKMWVEVADDLGSNQTIYIYYGKSGAATDSNITDTMIFGDDLAGVLTSSLDYNTHVAASGKTGSHDVAISGNYAFACGYQDDALYVFDITDPSSPTLETTLTDGSSRLDGIHDIVIDGSYAYVTNINRDSIVSIDISTPTSPSISDEVIDATKLDYVHALTKSGNYIYAGHYVDGTSNYFNIIDATDPTDMSLIGSVQDSVLNGARGIQVVGNTAFTVCRNSGRIVALNVTTKSSPSIISSTQLTTTSGAKLINIKVVGDYAYVTNYIDNELMIIDVSNTSSMVEVGSVTVPTANYLEINGNIAYVSSAASDGIWVVDITDPSDPVILDSYTSTTYLDMACQMRIDGDYLICSMRDTADKILTVLDITEAINIDATKWNKSGSPTISSGILNVNADEEYVVSKDVTFQYKTLEFRADFQESYSRCQIGFKDSASDTAPFEMFWKGVASNGIRCYSGYDGANIESNEVTDFGDAFHDYKIKWKSGEAKFYIDGNIQATHTTKVMTTAEPIYIYKSTAAAGEVDVDWIFVRKYADTEPAFSSAGSEETPPVTGHPWYYERKQ